MSNSAYSLAGRVLYMFVKPIWRRLATGKPRTRVLVVDGEKIVLVKNWLSTQNWRLPGGGRKHGEAAIDAAAREIGEELGIHVSPSQLINLGPAEIKEEKWAIKADLFSLRFPASKLKANSKEIIDIEVFDINKLPDSRPAVVDIAIASYRGIVDNKGVKP